MPIWSYPPRFEEWTDDKKKDWLASYEIPDLEKVDEVLYFNRRLDEDSNELASVSGCPRVARAVLKAARALKTYVSRPCQPYFHPSFNP